MLGTFHSICARILRREAEHLPLGSNFVIFDTDDQERIVKAVIRELNINEKLYRPPSVHAAISRAKNELIGPDQYPTTDVPRRDRQACVCGISKTAHRQQCRGL